MNAAVQHTEFEAHWRNSVSQVRAYISAVLFERSLLDDLVQNTAMAAYQKFDQYDAARPFTAWAVGIARFEVLRAHRSTARGKVVFDSAILDKVTAVYQERVEQYDERREALKKCVGRLPQDRQALLRMRYFDSMAYSDIASAVGSQEGAVRTMLCRLRSSLEACIRQRLAQQGIQA